jgi:hypothetical protein
MNLLAFHGKQSEKTKILKQLRAHAKAYELIKGMYWEDGKGCAIGCAIHSDDHALYEDRFGIPQMLAHLEDRIFEGLPNAAAKKWPVQFMSAIKPGADLSCVGWQFLHWLLTDKEINPGIGHPLVRDAVKQCADLLVRLTKGKRFNTGAAWSAPLRAAESAAESARSAAWSVRSAARSAAWSAALRAAVRAAESAAESARSAAWSVRSAAWSAPLRAALRAAESAAESAAWSAAVRAAFILMAKKLLQLLKAAPACRDFPRGKGRRK